ATGLATDSLDNLPDALAKDLGEGQVSLRVLAEASEQLTAQVNDLRAAAGLSQDAAQDMELAQALSELRLIKDDFEVREMRKAVAATYSGFDEIIRNLPRAVAHHRG
ncbi:hypothetical protein ACX3T8_04615, partial [Corynebacterium pyruviciproducens]